MTYQPSITVSGPYIADGVDPDFDFDFKIYASTDLAVYSTIDGVEDVIDPGNYSVPAAAINNELGGTITLMPNVASGTLVTIKLLPIVQQQTNLRNQGPYDPGTVEKAIDRIAMICLSLSESVDRAVKVPVSSDTDPDDLIMELTEDAASAAASASTATGASATAVSASATAVAAAATATALVNSILWNDVIYTTTTPLTINQSYNGKLVVIDTSGGNKVVNLPTIAGLTFPYNIGIQKSTNDANTVTINRGGSDTIDSATSLVLDTKSGVTLVPDTDPSPDNWAVFRFGIVPDASITGAKLVNNIAIPGSPTTTTQAASTNNTTIATTAQVQGAIQQSGKNSQGTKTISTSAPSGTPTDGDLWYRI